MALGQLVQIQVMDSASDKFLKLYQILEFMTSIS